MRPPLGFAIPRIHIDTLCWMSTLSAAKCKLMGCARVILYEQVGGLHTAADDHAPWTDLTIWWRPCRGKYFFFEQSSSCAVDLFPKGTAFTVRWICLFLNGPELTPPSFARPARSSPVMSERFWSFVSNQSCCCCWHAEKVIAVHHGVYLTRGMRHRPCGMLYPWEPP